jgi:hypothetical protein
VLQFDGGGKRGVGLEAEGDATGDRVEFRQLAGVCTGFGEVGVEREEALTAKGALPVYLV